ncbi:HAD family hydrolase [Paraconexibacter sp.]|uniref:HAD family hydrolase n=1 Tax=Paraconexibacter sp. TaxID=2949640 RepID=UPI00356B415A
MTSRRYDLVLLDALGTILDLEPPGPHLAAALERRGARVTPDDAHAAMVTEMTYYRANCDTAGSLEALAGLRERCARIVADELGAPVAGLGLDEIGAAMLEALRFPPFPEVEPVLRELGSAGVRLIVVSNWDISLHEVLRRTGLEELIDAALTSAESGASKPDPLMLHRAMAMAGDVDPQRTLMVGDTPPDALAAAAAGIDGVLVDRYGVVGSHPTARVVPDLGALTGLVLGGPGYSSQDA